MAKHCFPILFTFFGFLMLEVLGGERMSLDMCCKTGRVHGLKNERCDSLPYISHSQFCRMFQKQCCNAAVGEKVCTEGISSAKRNGLCDFSHFQTDPFKVNNAKMCCECCVLGLLAKKENHSCQLQISLTLHCRTVAQMCCLEKEHDSIHRGSPLLRNTSTVVGSSNQEADLCAEGVTRCSQMCVGNGSCVCLKGFYLKSDGYSCEDYNECLSGAHGCRPGESCINTEGSYHCQRETSCGTGYELTNANTCQDIDECLVEMHNCGQEFVCQNTAGSFRCHPRHQCGTGFIQDAAGKCIDVNECVYEKNPCQFAHRCINTLGSYTCQRFSVTCGHGYHLNTEGTHCIDNDECKISPGTLCAHRCDNTPGSYKCSCHSGFKLARDGKNCEGINARTTQWSKECENVYGYQCYCHHGYQLNTMDRQICEGVVCSYHCLNLPGGYECTCPPTGYSLSPSGHTCLDVDECETGTHNCSSSQNCFNILGGFRCLSFQCPPFYRRASERRCERLPCEQNSGCQSLPLKISFYNLTFPTNIPVPAAVFHIGPTSSVPGDNIQLLLVDGDAEEFFSIQKTTLGGVVSVQKPLLEPRDFLLTVEIRLIRYGIRSVFVAKIAVFVVPDQLGVSNNWTNV